MKLFLTLCPGLCHLCRNNTAVWVRRSACVQASLIIAYLTWDETSVQPVCCLGAEKLSACALKMHLAIAQVPAALPANFFFLPVSQLEALNKSGSSLMTITWEAGCIWEREIVWRGSEVSLLGDFWKEYWRLFTLCSPSNKYTCCTVLTLGASGCCFQPISIEPKNFVGGGDHSREGGNKQSHHPSTVCFYLL